MSTLRFNALICTLLGLAASLSGVAASPGWGASPLADCQAHGGVLASRHSDKALMKGYRAIPVQVRVAEDCGQAIASQLEVYGPPSDRPAGVVLRDCLRHGGRLIRRYSRRTLARANRELRGRRRRHTRCLIGILSQLRGLGSKVALTRPQSGSRMGRLAQEDAGGVEAAISQSTKTLRRPVQAQDALKPLVRNFLAQNIEAGYDLDQARRVGALGEAMWLVVGRGRVCIARQYGDEAASAACELADDYAAGRPVVVVGARPDNRHEIYGVIPDFVRGPVLVFGDGRRHHLNATSNAIFFKADRLPSLLTWVDGSGRRDWLDTTRTVCAPEGNHCLQVPALRSARI
jgi:hypothetical protein